MDFLTKKSWADYADDDDENIKVELNNENNENNEENIIMEFEIDIIESSLNKQELFKKVIKKSNKKINIPIVYELREFIQCLHDKKKPNIDFIIDESAHCDNTYKGTLCKNIKNCTKIHIQRCIKGDECKNKRCSFIHKYNMPDEKSKFNFEKTMNTYNKIKPNKKVNKN